MRKPRWLQRSEEFSWTAGVLVLVAFLAICGVWQLAAMYFGYKRYFVSGEFLLALICLAVGWRWIGSAAFLIASLLELLLGAASMLKLFNAEQLLTMWGFAFEANSHYMLLAALGILLLMTLWYGIVYWTPLLGLRHALPVGILLVFFQGGMSFADGNFLRPVMAAQDRLLLGGAIVFLNDRLELNRQVFELTRADNVEYVPIKHTSAVQAVWPEGPSARKVMLVVAESWGLPRNAQWLDEQLAPILRVADRAEHPMKLSLGSIHAAGTTVFGEYRELCGKIPTKLNLKEISHELVRDCLPFVMRKNGYQTFSVHGAASSMYDRKFWYPVLGFRTMLFAEQLAERTPKRCYSFPGMCDDDMTSVVEDIFRNNQDAFVYWMTLNSHIPYDERDLADTKDLHCEKWSALGLSQQLCNYDRLHRQFFENLARLLAAPGMRGAEVLIVGDHPPPFNDAEARAAFVVDRVPYLHIRVR